ncbi:MAG TPA: TetR/AcrR family transcriptional regulator [Kofleriaceae bacterium]|nr:TetR/AcrR family transcriptional regulator [Kofleriaceae bacterium]
MTTAQERKQQERTARRRRIQRAARTVFAEKGYAKTSIEQIAREASLSVGAIYLYFRSKEDLYVSLLEETLDLFDTELRQIRARSEVSAPERLRNAWSFLTQWAATDVEASRVLRLISQPNVRSQLSDEVVESVGKGLAQVREHLGAIVQDGMASGQYRRGATQPMVDLFWCLLLGVLESNDARSNLDLQGAGYNDLTQYAFAAIDTTLRQQELQEAHQAA